ncbi:conserved hypothetical protein [Crenothrix polyspora]|uniref:Uncharacterized protein n=1 Tax=Crenothrix polyspora TaxID=360316 RepID=A0A1R4H1V2_9GAMM|nr:hypothetical protein [Crenothrix polyspora]SJM90030.1 conserved hypothetical protein [Crenothrix polyspora]
MPSPANVFNLNSSHIHVSYATGALGSKAGLTYHDAHQTLQFNEQDIRKVTTDLGDELTVTLHRTEDVGSTTFTLIIPTVALEVNQHINVHTIGITSMHQRPFAPVWHGQLDSYIVVKLHGTASSQPF